MLVRNFTFKVSSQLLAAIMAFVSLLVMTRYVADQYGLMIWALALVTLVNTVADLGFNTANLKFISREDHDRSACFSTYMVIKLALTGVMVLCTFITVYSMRLTGAIDDEAVKVCLVFVIYQIISNVQFAIYYTLDGMKLSGKSSILTIVECGIRNAVLIGMALYEVDATTLANAYVIATTISLFLSFYMAHQVGLRPVKPKYLREYTVFALPLAAALILTAVVTNLDKVIVGLFYESIEVTYYSTAVGLIATFTAVGVSLNNVLLPHLSSRNIIRDRVTERTLWGLEKGLCILLLPFVAFFLVFGPQVAETLFGPGFGPSGEMTAILSIQIIPFVIAGIMTQVLYAINRGISYLRASTIMCVIAVGGFLLLIPNTTIPFSQGWGGMGAAVSVSAAYIVFCIILCWMVRRYTNIRLYPKLWRVFIAFVLSALALWGIGQVVEVSGILWLAIVGFACEAIFIGILMATKVLKVSEIKTVLRMFIKDEDDRIASADRCGTASCASRCRSRPRDSPPGGCTGIPAPLPSDPLAAASCSRRRTR